MEKIASRNLGDPKVDLDPGPGKRIEICESAKETVTTIIVVGITERAGTLLEVGAEIAIDSASQSASVTRDQEHLLEIGGKIEVIQQPQYHPLSLLELVEDHTQVVIGLGLLLDIAIAIAIAIVLLLLHQRLLILLLKLLLLDL